MPHSVEMVTVAGCAIRLFRGGPARADARKLVFLHGAGGHTGWMRFLDELATRFAVFAPEHPGFGQSDDPPWLDEIADLAYFHLDLLKALGLDHVHLMGTSLGGWVAAEMAVRNTARLASLTLVGAVGITAGGAPIPDIFRMPVEENLRHFYADPERAARRTADLARADMSSAAKKRCDCHAPRLPPALPQSGAGEMAAPHRCADAASVGRRGRSRTAEIRRDLPRAHPGIATSRAAASRPRPVRRTEGRLPRGVPRFYRFTMRR